jgi:subtilisin family serine protease
MKKIPTSLPALTLATAATIALFPAVSEALTISQGDTAMRADIARSRYGVSGRNITVGVISDSFDNLGGTATDIANGDLPSSVTILNDLSGNGTDEGRGLAHLVYDSAPGSNFLFHSAFNETIPCEVHYANAIDNLVRSGARIIVSDAACQNDPMFQEGRVSQAINRAKDAGIPVFISAGNEGRRSYESAFRSSGVIDSNFGLLYHDFDPDPVGVDIFQKISLGIDNSLDLTFQWDEAFGSISNGVASTNDLDILLFDSTGTNLLAASAEDNIGHDPLEHLFFFNDTGETTFNLAIAKKGGGSAPGLMKYVVFGGGRNFSIDEYYDPTVSSLYGIANARGAFAIGAADYTRTPVFGVDPAESRGFSSAGGTPLLFDSTGARLTGPLAKSRPDIIGPDGVCTPFFGIDIGGGCFFFPGTSASVAAVAGVAALMLEANPNLSPDRLYDILRQTARDMDDPATPGFDTGFDFKTGFGFIDAEAAVGRAAADANSIPEPSTLWGLLLCGIFGLLRARGR